MFALTQLFAQPSPGAADAPATDPAAADDGADATLGAAQGRAQAGADGSETVASSDGVAGDDTAMDAASTSDAIEGPIEPAPLRVTSSPSGATVYVDGLEVGTTPFEKVLPEGKRFVEVQKDGYVLQSRFVTIDPASAPEPIDVTLEEQASTFPYEPLGWAGVAVGAAALISGIALIAIDENPYKARCEGEDIDAMGRCRFQYNTLAGGVTGVILGAALVGGGAALLVLGRKRGGGKSTPRDTARANLRLGVSARGVSLSGQF
ncbi:MAG: PEGA domain-containing protein [Myxococcales bacterium]|nr:PEGA domain-containing protein [Myxococcales bacterium]